MKTPLSRTSKGKLKAGDSWPRKVQPGRAVVNVYRRTTPSGGVGFMVANYADGERRRFDSYSTETDALEAADALAKRLDKREYVAASMTKEQAIEFASVMQSLNALGLSLIPAVSTLTEAVKLVGDLPSVLTAAKAYADRKSVV